MSRIVLNSENINETLNHITFIVKNAKNNYKNYIIQPNISISLYNSKVSWVDGSCKNLCLCFNKYDNMSLKNMLKIINDKINNKTDYFYSLENKISIFYEKGDYFYVKCFLPPNINYTFDGLKETYSKPRVGIIIKQCIIDIRNVWMNNDTKNVGIHLELKEINI